LNDSVGALKILDGLSQAAPDDPYFHEMRGQILYERGRMNESVTAFAAAARLMPDSGLIQLGYGQALLAAGDLDRAIATLNRAVQAEPDSASARRSLGIAYGRNGQTQQAQLELAESAILTLDYRAAQRHAKSAKFPPGTPGAMRVADINALAEEKIKEKEKKAR
jgi:predicted Zn-dependent protease